MPTPFLSVYKSLDQFVGKYPDFGALRKPRDLDIVLLYDKIEEKLACMGVNTKAPSFGIALADLLRLHTLKDLSQGILTLVGVGKGQNSRLMHRGTYVAKFNPDDVWQQKIMDDVAALTKMDRCVALAKKMAHGAVLALEKPVEGVPADAMLHHMKVALTDELWTTVAKNFASIDRGLDGVFRIAANRPDPRRTGVGYVRFKKIDNEDDVSPSKTAIVPKALAGETTHGGSIHMDFKVFGAHAAWTDLGVATVIVHEASHKFCGTDDHGYHHEETKYDGLSKELRTDNADSYALVAASIEAGKVLTDRNTKALTA